jgi:predicted PurR-regulated permease PerM
MDWIWRNTLLAAAISAVVAILLYLLGLPQYAAFALMAFGALLMMHCEATRSEK